MSKHIIIFLILSLCLSLTACSDAVKDAEPLQTEGGTVSEGAEDVSADISAEAEKIINESVVFECGSDTVLVRGEAFSMEAPPFTESGVLYVPASACVYIRGASFVKTGDVYRINDRGKVTLAMEDYDVILVGGESLLLDASPVEKDGVFFLTAEGLGAALSSEISVTRDGFLCVFGSAGRIPQSKMNALSAYLGVAVDSTLPEEILSLGEKYGEDAERIAESALYGELWSGSADGDAVRYRLGFDGELSLTVMQMNYTFPEGKLMIEKAGQLYSADGKTVLCDLPGDIFARELKAATARYMELLAACHIKDDAEARLLAESYLNAVTGDLRDPVYASDREAPYSTGLYDASSGEAAFDRLFEAAQVGDVLTFSADGAGAEYGFFNHCSVIMEKNEETRTLRLLHARGFEYGVGADLEMDLLSYGSFDEIEYYSGYTTVFLCRARGVDVETKAALVGAAYEKYNGYSFGYGGRMGLEETNCTELVRETYLQAGVDLTDGDYESRLKEVLGGATKNIVMIPDDLLLSDKMQVIAVFVR